MQHLTVLSLLFALSFLSALGQAPVKTPSFELGTELIGTSNSMHLHAPTQADPLNYLSGLFFRYTKNKTAVRTRVNYADKTFIFDTSRCNDCPEGNETYKTFRLAAGGQYSILQKRDWLYAFGDIQYLSFSLHGEGRGGFIGNENFSYSIAGKGIALVPGIGFKIRLLRQAFISSELDYQISNISCDFVRLDRNTGALSTVHTNTGNLPEARILLSARF